MPAYGAKFTRKTGKMFSSQADGVLTDCNRQKTIVRNMSYILLSEVI